MKNVEDALAAATFAEEGQAATARSIMKEGRRVLLALKEGRIDARTLKYALNTSKRIGADLDILHVAATGNASIAIDPLLANFQSELKAEGIVYRMIQKTGCPRSRSSIIRTVKRRSFSRSSSPRKVSTRTAINRTGRFQNSGRS
jgi:hypothetical protein